MNFRWSVTPLQPLIASQLAADAGLPQLVAHCLVHRGITEAPHARDFLEPRLRRLGDPFNLPDMREAVDRLFKARAAREPVILFGDYDVDGVTACALIGEVLSGLGWQIEIYLPHRMDEGYGLSQAAVENCHARFPQARLMVAVDCGSTAVESISWLGRQGVDVIVLDHHQFGASVPEARALVNPIRLPETAPERPLCSAGLAFKLAHAVVKEGRRIGGGEFAGCDVRQLLDLVALGTVADLVPLTGENRILVQAGLEHLSQTTRPGLVALKNVAQCQDQIGVYEIGYQLGPRLNAAGRLETADESLRLLQSRSLTEARPLAESLDARNRERQAIERQVTDEALAALRGRFDPARDYVIVEGRNHWHIGVVGIVASRLVREFHRPTLVLGGEADAWRGSGRSIAGFDLAAALRECGDLLIKHGGHAMAAGVSVHADRVESFRERLNEIAQRSLAPEQLRPEIRLDAEARLPDMTMELLEALNRLSPFGQGNPPVHLAFRGLELGRDPRRMGREQQHLRFQAVSGSARVDCVWWGAGSRAIPKRFDLAAIPEIHEYQGIRKVQLRVLDLREAS